MFEQHHPGRLNLLDPAPALPSEREHRTSQCWRPREPREGKGRVRGYGRVGKKGSAGGIAGRAASSPAEGPQDSWMRSWRPGQVSSPAPMALQEGGGSVNRRELQGEGGG